MNKLKVLLASASAAVLTACGGVDVQTYADQKPPLDLPVFFDGTLDAWGIFQKRNGELVRRFHVEIIASWESPTKGQLDEYFTYSDGEKQRRVWILIQQPDGTWRGTADDVKGEAIGKVAGNALHWKYVLQLPVDGKVYDVNFDDWMWQLDENTMMNRSVMSKFGFDLGEVSLFFKKRTQP
uniref:DUF3833 domain-containing protein n=1 Tax=Orrella sp. TaxID=1921583 RepID=UPI0040488AD0